MLENSRPLDGVLVAWNASREATRAVNDAMPLLAVAEEVTVLAIDPREGPNWHGQVPGADISLHLARHGVKATINRSSRLISRPKRCSYHAPRLSPPISW